MKNLIKKVCLFGYAMVLRYTQWYMRTFKREQLAKIVCMCNMSTEEWIALEMQDKELELNEKLNIK